MMNTKILVKGAVLARQLDERDRDGICSADVLDLVRMLQKHIGNGDWRC